MYMFGESNDPWAKDEEGRATCEEHEEGGEIGKILTTRTAEKRRSKNSYRKEALGQYCIKGREFQRASVLLIP